MPSLTTPPREQPNRDSVSTIRSDGSRPFLFPADVRGRFDRARRLSAYGLIALYCALPWIQINGHPAVFLDVAERRFHLFGITLAAQDLFLLFFLITGLGFSLFFITALLGRVWCGWACPQTVFLDHVFRRIERWVDGDALKRRALAHAPLSARKVTKRVVKHAFYLAVSALVTHIFLAYFVSLPAVWSMITAAPMEHWAAFGFIVVATGIVYFNFAWFREQLCIVICPYGRMQSALIDDHSLVVGYDARRGEPRGRPGVPDAGACVDCTRCVQVCPTGIDIRQGLQMECIGCTACIDACDDVMTRLGRPRGLIRYDSQIALSGGRTRWIRGRTVLYFVMLLIGAGVTTWALTTVKPANASVTRMTGAPYVVDENAIRNQYLVRVLNKRNVADRFQVRISGAPANTRHVGSFEEFEVQPLAEVVRPLVMLQPRSEYNGPFDFNVVITDARGGFSVSRTVEFVGPDARLLREEEKEQREKQ